MILSKVSQGRYCGAQYLVLYRQRATIPLLYRSIAALRQKKVVERGFLVFQPLQIRFLSCIMKRRREKIEDKDIRCIFLTMPGMEKDFER